MAPTIQNYSQLLAASSASQPVLSCPVDSPILSLSSRQIITFFVGQVYSTDGREPSRLSFAGDYLSGDASLLISDLLQSDSGEYSCKVKTGGRYHWCQVNLIVLGEGGRTHTHTHIFSHIGCLPYVKGVVIDGLSGGIRCTAEHQSPPPFFFFVLLFPSPLLLIFVRFLLFGEFFWPAWSSP